MDLWASPSRRRLSAQPGASSSALRAAPPMDGSKADLGLIKRGESAAKQRERTPPPSLTGAGLDERHHLQTAQIAEHRRRWMSLEITRPVA